MLTCVYDMLGHQIFSDEKLTNLRLIRNFATTFRGQIKTGMFSNSMSEIIRIRYDNCNHFDVNLSLKKGHTVKFSKNRV